MSKPKYSVKPLDILAKKTVNLKQNSFQEYIKIFLRIKPQDNRKSLQSIAIVNQQQVQVIPPYFSTQTQRLYHYQQVFEPETTNLKVFQKTMLEPISNVLSGFNSTVFIYGMTGAGKTHTMFNSPLSNDPGMVGSALIHLFHSIAISPQSQFQVKLSFFQIYNENIRDLLIENKEPLTIMEDAVQGVFISELKEVQINNEKQGYRLIEEGMGRRAREATKNNQFSSRSHAILQFKVKKMTVIEGTAQAQVQESKLFMIDLAGNQKTSQNQNKRFLEGVNINKSLLTLGKCINILSEKKKNAYIPYRESKLTRILKDSLGGNSKTVMIACISSQSKFYEETLNTLKYSSKAKQIKNKGKGGEITKVSINSLPSPQQPQNKVTLQDQDRLFSFINTLESILTDKVKTEKVQEELEQCLLDCRKENNFKLEKQINCTLGRIKERQATVMNSMGEEIKNFVAYINSLKQSKSPEKKETTLEEQNQRKLSQIMIQRQFQSSISKASSSQDFPHFKTETEKQMKAQVEDNPLPVCLSQVQNIHSHQVCIPEKRVKKQTKKNNPAISIRIESCRNSNKENIVFNPLRRSSTSHSSLKSQKGCSQQTVNKVVSNRPLIDITKDDYKVRSPSMKQQLLKRCDSSSKQVVAVELKGGSFVERLKQIDKIANQANSQVLHALLEEYERQKYQLSRVENSMVNKLKFVLKNRSSAESSRAVSLGQEKPTAN